ncbi:hypothetical protein EPH_0072050 [Eimeria praecox]|uniref:Uncharacterized protein n=1 Tax=Eimeria praecox TaxID=51316 RepID=U6H6F8_9EIME|nr:hypothetical protein EPH_0072050 [Eimeria praecox]
MERQRLRQQKENPQQRRKALPVAPKADGAPAAKAAEGESAAKEGGSEEAKDAKAPASKAGPALLPKKAASVLPKKAMEKGGMRQGAGGEGSASEEKSPNAGFVDNVATPASGEQEVFASGEN